MKIKICLNIYYNPTILFYWRIYIIALPCSCSILWFFQSMIKTLWEFITAICQFNMHLPIHTINILFHHITSSTASNSGDLISSLSFQSRLWTHYFLPSYQTILHSKISWSVIFLTSFFFVRKYTIFPLTDLNEGASLIEFLK